MTVSNVDDARGRAAAPRLRAPPAGRTPWLPTWSRDAAVRAVRVVIVIAPLFALAFEVIANMQIALFVGFGGIATLVLASFGGTRRDKLVAHLGLAVAGSVLLTIGTLVSFSVAVAAVVTVPVAFTVFFSGLLGPNTAVGATSGLLAYVLPAASPGTVGVIPDRLAGWWLVSVLGTIAVLVTSRPAGADPLRAAAARLCEALGEEIEAMLAGSPTDALRTASMEARDRLLDRFTATPYRPTGLAAADEALGNSVELLEWTTLLVDDMVRELHSLRDAAATDRELLAAAASVMRDSGRLLQGDDVSPGLDRLDALRSACITRVRRLGADGAAFEDDARVAYHAGAVALAALAVGADALLAERRVDAEWFEEARTRWLITSSTFAPRTRRRLSALAQATSGQATVRSVWLINSLRGALAIAAAVAVADLTSVQHAFWVVLGTLSVLRTNAASTGATALRALAGTVAGSAIGAGLVLAIGSSQVALWVAFPVALAVAAYAPGTAPFAVGQAAFTVLLVVLFNLLVPVGWKVGVVRVGDVAIGCAVSLFVGSLFWPRGAAAIVADDLADAFRSGASYLRRRLRLTAQSVAQLPCDGGGAVPATLASRAAALETWYERLATLLRPPRSAPVIALHPPAVDPPAHAAARSPESIWLAENLDQLAGHLGELVEPATHIAQVRQRPWWR